MIIEQVIAASLIMTTPILLAAMGGLVNRQAGIVNIALDAKMLAGAFVAVIVSSATDGWFVAVLAAALCGAAIGYLFSLVITRANANMIVAGLGLNVLVAGFLGFILNWVYNSSGTLRLPGVHLLPHVLPESSGNVPLIGGALADLDPLTLFAWGSVLALPWLLANTRLGLRLRAAGNAPQVARAVGLSEREPTGFRNCICRLLFRSRRSASRTGIDRAVQRRTDGRARLHRPRGILFRPQPAGHHGTGLPVVRFS